jgi:predicted lipid-binding transport protein (Tim44 family)
MDFRFNPDDGRVFLLAIGLGAIVGVIIGGWVMTALQRLVMALLQVALLGAVAAIAFALWNHYRGFPPPDFSSLAPSSGSASDRPLSPSPSHPQAAPKPVSGRWWEEH